MSYFDDLIICFDKVYDIDRWGKRNVKINLQLFIKVYCIFFPDIFSHLAHLSV